LISVIKYLVMTAKSSANGLLPLLVQGDIVTCHI